MKRTLLIVFGLVLALIVSPGVPRSYALENPGSELSEAKIDPKLGAKLDLGLIFTDSEGKTAPIREIVRADRPIVIVPVYYNCPRLCGFLLDGVTKLINELPFQLGTDFTLLTISFAANEGPELARKRRDHFHAQVINQGGLGEGWRFLVGDKQHITPLMQTLGFGVKPDGEDFAHGAALFILTPHGEISQYFTGVDFSANDVRLSLVEASKGRIGSAIDQILLFCFRYDHIQGRYTWAVFNIVRVVGLLTLGALVFLIYQLYRGSRGRREPTRAV